MTIPIILRKLLLLSRFPLLNKDIKDNHGRKNFTHLCKELEQLDWWSTILYQLIHSYPDHTEKGH